MKKNGIVIYKDAVSARAKNRRMTVYTDKNESVVVNFQRIIPATEEVDVVVGEIRRKRYMNAAIKMSIEGAHDLCEVLMHYLKSTEYTFEKPALKS